MSTLSPAILILFALNSTLEDYNEVIPHFSFFKIFIYSFKFQIQNPTHAIQMFCRREIPIFQQ